jgi:16S rRNA (guanine966-N2)-methyltransferase
VRIAGGNFRGRKLFAPPDLSVRPTSEKVRQAIFNMLASRGLPEGCVVADIFCGTGALGLEALSRGAAQCTFLDKSRASLALCARNIEACGLSEDRTRTVQGDARKLPVLPAGADKAALVFIDPPYRKNLVLPALQGLIAAGWTADPFTAVIEMSADEPVPTLPGSVRADKIYGDTRVILADIGCTVK